MNVGPTIIQDTFAEAFSMRCARLIVTAADDHWLAAALAEATGYASSVIACDVEAAVERRLAAGQTPDGRGGAAILFFGFSAEALGKALAARTGQCLMTCPTTAVFDGLREAAERVALGRHLRFFGDGYQKSKLLGERRYWRIPVMDGEFLVEETAGIEKGIAGGNLILQGREQTATLAAARRAVESIAAAPGVITPFPGGVVRSGSKVGSRYKALKASTAHAYCPTLRGRTQTLLHPDANCCYEIVINGTSREAIADAMRRAMHAAAGDDLVAITAGNYGGKLGKHHFHLHALLSAGATA